MVLSSAPYTTTSSYQRERFLRAFTKEWDFSKLSEFFMYLQSPANIDYKVKCVMLQEAARRERETLSAKLRKKRVVVELPTIEVTVLPPKEEEQENNTGRRHHRRTSSNDVNDIKRLRLSTPDLDHSDNTQQDTVNFGSLLNNNNNGSSSSSITTPTTTNITNTTAASSSSSSRRSASPDHHHHHHSTLRCVTTNTTGMSSELSHLHLTNTATTSTSSRRRSSSIISNESFSTADDPMDTNEISKKRGTSSMNTHFVTAEE